MSERVRLLAVLGLVAGIALTTPGSPASAAPTPERPATAAAAVVAAVAPNHTITRNWRGSIPPGPRSYGLQKCRAGTRVVHDVTIASTRQVLRTHRTFAVFTVSWLHPELDERMYVTDAKGRILGTSDAYGIARESVALQNLPKGTYRVVTCPSAKVGKRVAYRGIMTLTTSGLGNSFSDAYRFTPATVVDPILFGGEPGLTFDNVRPAAQRSFVDWPVSSRQNIGVLFRSTDGGLSYGKRYADYSSTAQDGSACLGRQVPFCASGGGGDTQLHVNPKNGIVYFTSQESLANQAVGTSFDHGDTFPGDHVDPVTSQASGDVDRQWLASWDGTRTVFLAYHSPLVGEFIQRSDKAGATTSWYNPSGANTPQIPGVTQSGAMFTDDGTGIHRHAIYIGYLGALDGHFDVGVSTDGAKTFVSHPVPADNARNFTKITLDKAGNLYATWTDSVTQKSYMSTSKGTVGANVKAPGTTWSKAVQISDPSQHVTIFPDIVAGSPGRVAIGYYGTTAKGPTPDDVKPGQGGWNPIMAMSMNALCQWDAKPCARPSFSQSHVSHQINQDDNICTSGTTCAATMGNRNLLDYFTPALDSLGHVAFVWSDGTNATKLPFVKVARQTTGPSLFAGGKAVYGTARGNGYQDKVGDALYPIAGAQIETAHNHPALDLVGTSVRTDYKAKRLIFHIKLNRTAGLASAVPGGGTGHDGSTPLQQAKYVVRWDYKGNTYYAAANLAAGSSKPTYLSGTVDMTEGLLAAGGTAPYGNSYSSQTAATGSVGTNYLEISVPTSAVGSPRPGTTLVSVGSYTTLGPLDAAATLNTAPITVDSTPTFDYRLGPAPQGTTFPRATSITATPVLVTTSWLAGGFPDLSHLGSALTRTFADLIPTPTSALAENPR